MSPALALLAAETFVGIPMATGISAANSKMFNISKPKAIAVYSAAGGLTGIATGAALGVVASASAILTDEPLVGAGLILAGMAPAVFASHKVGQKAAEKYCDTKVADLDVLRINVIGAGEAALLVAPLALAAATIAISGLWQQCSTGTV